MSGTMEDVAAAVEASTPEPAWPPVPDPPDAAVELPDPDIQGEEEQGDERPARRAAARARAGRRASLTAELRTAAAQPSPPPPAGAGETLRFAPGPADPPPAPTWSLAPVEEPESVEAPPPPGVITDPLIDPVEGGSRVVPVELTPAPPAPPGPVFRLEPEAGEVAAPTPPARGPAPRPPAPRATGRPGSPAVEAQETGAFPGVTALDLGGRRRRRSRPTAMPPRPAEVFEVAEDASGRVVYIDPPQPRLASPFLVTAESQPAAAPAPAPAAVPPVSGWVAVAVLAAALVIIFMVGMRLTA